MTSFQRNVTAGYGHLVINKVDISVPSIIHYRPIPIVTKLLGGVTKIIIMDSEMNLYSCPITIKQISLRFSI